MSEKKRSRLKAFTVAVLLTAAIAYFGATKAKNYVAEHFYEIERPCAVVVEKTNSHYQQFLRCENERYIINQNSVGTIEQRMEMLFSEQLEDLVPYKNELGKNALEIPGAFDTSIEQTLMDYSTELMQDHPMKYKENLLENTTTAGKYFPSETAAVLPENAQEEVLRLYTTKRLNDAYENLPEEGKNLMKRFLEWWNKNISPNADGQ